jgi:DNA-binding MarR family transcriptional regulator
MTGTRWLTRQEQEVWRSFLCACQTLFSAIEAQLQRDAGLPHPYYEILVRLSEAPGHALRMSQLAEASASSKSRISHAVARLEERGWVSRLDCPTDRRGQIAQLTDEGYAALAAAAPGHVEQVRKSLFDVLTVEQVRQLGVIAQAMAGVGAGDGVAMAAGGCGLDGTGAGAAAVAEAGPLGQR